MLGELQQRLAERQRAGRQESGDTARGPLLFGRRCQRLCVTRALGEGATPPAVAFLWDFCTACRLPPDFFVTQLELTKESK